MHTDNATDNTDHAKDLVVSCEVTPDYWAAMAARRPRSTNF